MSLFISEGNPKCFFCKRDSICKKIEYRGKYVLWCRSCSFVVENDYKKNCDFCNNEMYDENDINPSATLSDCGEYYIEGGMGSPIILKGRMIFHNGENKYWCASTTCTLPHCKVKTCKWCKPGDIHFCRKCGMIDSDHFTKDCPN